MDGTARHGPWPTCDVPIDHAGLTLRLLCRTGTGHESNWAVPAWHEAYDLGPILWPVTISTHDRER